MIKASKIIKSPKERLAKTAKIDEPQLIKPKTTARDQKPRSRLASKRSGKGAPGQSFGEASQSSEDNVSQTLSQSPTVFEDNTEPFRLKGKKHHTRDCDEAVNKGVADFWDTAWNICAERFFIASAPVTVSFDLRNTWLGIVEAEWQDLDMRETPAKRPNRIFQRDEPPLPLAFDTWSRGAMEFLPRYRRESVLDPFLRDLDAIHDVFPVTDTMASDEMNDEGEASTETQEETRNSSNGTDLSGELDPYTGNQEPTDASELQWQADLEEGQQKRDSSSPATTSGPKTLDATQASSELQFVTILTPRQGSADESITDVDSPSHPIISIKGKRSQYTLYNPRKKFSPSQCGGRNGSGIFRLPTETTSEALLKRMNNAKSGNEDSGSANTNSNESQREVDHQPSQKKNSQLDDDDLEIQPLFEERTFPDPEAEFAETHRFHEIGWRGISYSEGHYNRGPSLDANTNAEKDTKFLKRKVANLQNRFKRQTIKFFANPLIQTPQVAQETSPPPVDRRKSSVLSAKRKSVVSEKKKSRGSQGFAREIVAHNQKHDQMFLDQGKSKPLITKGPITTSGHHDTTTNNNKKSKAQTGFGDTWNSFPSKILNTHGYGYVPRLSQGVNPMLPNANRRNKSAYVRESTCTTETCKKGTTTSS